MRTSGASLKDSGRRSFHEMRTLWRVHARRIVLRRRDSNRSVGICRVEMPELRICHGFSDSKEQDRSISAYESAKLYREAMESNRR